MYYFNYHRQIFGTLPKSGDQDDTEEAVSTLDILKAQRARKAAARKAKEEDSVTESDSEDEDVTVAPASRTSNPMLWNFSDEGAIPPGQRTAQAAIHFENTRPSTPPLASTSAPSHLRPSQSEPQASQQPHARQTHPTQTEHSSLVGESRHGRKKKKQ
jgi:hypothetical protein